MKHIIAAVFCLAIAPAATAEQVPLADLSRYLTGIEDAQAPFRQFNDDGSESTGRFYLKRPGRMRFEYDPPEAALVVAGGGAVVIFDGKSNQPAETYPLKRTPLGLILEGVVDLEAADMVVGHVFDGTHTIIRAQDPENPEYGSIDLFFGHAPLTLDRWVVNDGAGGRTMVDLGPLDTSKRLGNNLFNTTLVGDRIER
ncbi:MAG: outer membrane lipoprotein carrier protein LolA [Rhodobacteraceae bacterium]|nr:outer membrane lipoprotein carrier protein LolA [Paracoccaceae bacterium]